MFRLLPFIFCIPMLSFAQVSYQSLVVQPASTLSINGKTTVNKYECKIGSYSGSDTLRLRAEVGKGVTFSKGIAKLVANEFDCGVKIITNDFRETLQTEKYPFI